MSPPAHASLIISEENNSGVSLDLKNPDNPAPALRKMPATGRLMAPRCAPPSAGRPAALHHHTMPPISAMLQFARPLLGTILLIAAAGCAVVEVSTLTPRDDINERRGDILFSGELSRHTLETLQVAGQDPQACQALSMVCITALNGAAGLSEERRLAALSELWVQQATGHTPEMPESSPDPRLHAWLEAARHAYAYLFLTERLPGERSFEERQVQVTDYYNYATQAVSKALFAFRQQRLQAGDSLLEIRRKLASTGWNIETDFSGLREMLDPHPPDELLPASGLRFDGLRSVYRRDGLGAPMVAVYTDRPARAAGPSFELMPTPALTLVLDFPGANLEEVLRARHVRLEGYDPYRYHSVQLAEHEVPLAANFTAGYGVWLARAGFSRQAITTLLGRDGGIDAPRIYLMQPYDPSRRIILMVHGLASSPEAWVNLANEILGDATLREHYQIWQVYYPTNVPVGINRAAIEQALTSTLDALDPERTAPASCGQVLTGHSMGGLLSRLLVSSSGESFWTTFVETSELDAESLAQVEASVGALMRFEPLPQVERAIFLAAPHRGTEVAGLPIVHKLTQLIRLPVRLLQNFEGVLNLIAHPDATTHLKPKLATGVDHLNAQHPFVKAGADIPLRPGLRHHSIIARQNPDQALPESSDGLVPYWSSHLPTADSEIVITSGHSVQETPQAILEIRRILHEDLREYAERQKAAAPGTTSCHAGASSDTAASGHIDASGHGDASGHAPASGRTVQGAEAQ